MKKTASPTPDTPFSEEEWLEIRRAYHRIESFLMTPEHRRTKKILEVRLAEMSKKQGVPDQGTRA